MTKQEIVDALYYFFIKYSETFKTLSMDMQGEICIKSYSKKLIPISFLRKYE